MNFVNSGLTAKQIASIKLSHKKEARRIEELLGPFLKAGVKVIAPHVPAGEGITLINTRGKKVHLDAVGDDMTFLQVGTDAT